MGHDLRPLDIDVQALMRGLVHELRNPLSAILTASSLLPGAQGLDEETEMLLDVVSKEARRMNRILTEFSTFAKPPKQHPEPTDITVIVRELARAESKSSAPIAIQDEMPAELWAYADPHGTTQAIQHIIENAREVLPEGGNIRLTGGQKEESVWIAINDSGPGLSENSLERAFQPFFSNKPASTGLGLSIARMVLRASGGDCHIENAHDGGPNGAIVTVELPLAKARVEGQTERNEALQTA
ncbi:HAMP domain-containing histidine kinase [bacterium]|nr:MAG: HAMP domain-containing histidine kinase [bacterium]